MGTFDSGVASGFSVGVGSHGDRESSEEVGRRESTSSEGVGRFETTGRFRGVS